MELTLSYVRRVWNGVWSVCHGIEDTVLAARITEYAVGTYSRIILGDEIMTITNTIRISTMRLHNAALLQ